jgi:hypothetical protein
MCLIVCFLVGLRVSFTSAATNWLSSSSPVSVRQAAPEVMPGTLEVDLRSAGGELSSAALVSPGRRSHLLCRVSQTSSARTPPVGA